MTQLIWIARSRHFRQSLPFAQCSLKHSGVGATEIKECLALWYGLRKRGLTLISCKIKKSSGRPMKRTSTASSFLLVCWPFEWSGTTGPVERRGLLPGPFYRSAGSFNGHGPPDQWKGVLLPGPFQWSAGSFNGHGPVERRGLLHGPFYWSSGRFDDRWTSEKEFYCLVLSPGPLAVLMVMDHRTSGKEFHCRALSNGPLAVLAMDHWTNGKERSTTWSFLVVRR